MSTKRPPLKRIARLIARHQRESELLRARYSANGERLDRIVGLGVPLGEPITLPDGTQMVVRGQFAARNVAFKAASVSRYVIEPHRADRQPGMPRRPRRASTSDQPQPEGTEQI